MALRLFVSTRSLAASRQRSENPKAGGRPTGVGRTICGTRRPFCSLPAGVSPPSTASDRLTRGPTVAEDREWEAVLEKTGSKSASHLGRWVSCKYIQSAASIQVHQLAALEPEATV